MPQMPAGASAEERDSQGYSAYHWAVVQGDLETVLTFEDLFGADLSQRFASPAPPSDSLASLAVMSGSWEMVEHVPCTSQEAQECLEWIDTMLAAPLARPDEHDRTQFSEIKLVLQACLSVSAGPALVRSCAHLGCPASSRFCH